MRALLIVLDSVGIGNAPDAAKYGDKGADTLGHVFAHTRDLELPVLFSLGLDAILSGDVFEKDAGKRGACFGRMRERSVGKDTVTGHWELAGVVLDEPFTMVKKFPPRLVEAIEREAKVEFIGNYASSGTTILDELGEEHVRTGKPILYTSADSVMQIAAHEEVVPLRKLYEICRIARRHTTPLRIGRVIARPFIGSPGAWQRTANRHDYSMVPPRSVLNAISEAGLPVEGIGKISDIFANSGVTRSHPTESNAAGMKAIENVWHKLHDGLVFVNLVDFDSLHGHRRNIAGYADALREFDTWLGHFLPEIESDDLLIITADHGNDPAFHGTDHTREEVPLIVKFDGRSGPLGIRETYADVAATLGAFFHLKEKWSPGTPFLKFDRRTSHPFVQAKGSGGVRE